MGYVGNPTATIMAKRANGTENGTGLPGSRFDRVIVHPEHRLEQWEEESREAQARRRHERATCRIAAIQ
jgi:hypothetical protein